MAPASQFHSHNIPQINPHFLSQLPQKKNKNKKYSFFFHDRNPQKLLFFSHQEAPNPTSQSRTSTARVFSAALGSVGILSVKGDLDALDLVTEFDGGAELQVHALLHGGQS